MYKTMTRSRATTKPSTAKQPATTLTFMDHVRELQGRLFLVALVFVGAAVVAYPFFDVIVNFLIAPLGGRHELVYLTPGGALTFVVKVCMYVGLILTLPVIIYHLYRFLLPVVKQTTVRRALGFTAASFGLAMAGLLFAYYTSLPAALYFLTSFNLHDIDPMLTIDSYFSFVMTYLVAGALLFQLPLIVLIVNSIRPLTPKKMMRYQRHIIAGSFVVAAVISPTPDVLNQTILALPVVVMYQLGIVLIWWKNRPRRTRKTRRGHASAADHEFLVSEADLEEMIRGEARPIAVPASGAVQPAKTMPAPTKTATVTQVQLPPTQGVRPAPTRRSIDGLSIPTRRLPVRAIPTEVRQLSPRMPLPRRPQYRPVLDGILAPSR